MSADFHIFISYGTCLVTQDECFGQRAFPCLSDATLFLRSYAKAEDCFVVIHDGNDGRTNRIPLQMASAVESRALTRSAPESVVDIHAK
jgi:hypothetical protein